MQRYDVHAHAVWAGTGPEDHQAARTLVKREGFAGTVPGAGWSVEAAIAFMDEHRIDLQMLSTPGALGSEQARAWNDRTAGVIADHVGRFGLLAALPMGSPGRAVEEIRHALDALGADGFAVASNYDGAYLGDSRFEPIFDELNRRGAPLFVHPALPPAFDVLGLGRPGPLIEYPMDTARTVVDAVFAGVLLRHPNLTMILAHGGGVLPTLHERIASLGTEPWTKNPLHLTAEQIRTQLASVYLDTAIAGGRASIVPALEMVGADHLLFGTDYPPAGTATISTTLTKLTQSLSDAQANRLEPTFESLFPEAATRARRPLVTR